MDSYGAAGIKFILLGEKEWSKDEKKGGYPSIYKGVPAGGMSDWNRYKMHG